MCLDNSQSEIDLLFAVTWISLWYFGHSDRFSCFQGRRNPDVSVPYCCSPSAHYCIVDGFVAVQILAGFIPDKQFREFLMHKIGPVFDGIGLSSIHANRFVFD